MEVTLALQQRQHEAAARESWQALTVRVQNFPFPLPQHGLGIDFVNAGCTWRPEAIADVTILRARPTLLERARFCLADSFFAKSLNARVAILLHESIHVRMFTGRLAANHQVIAQTQLPDPNTMDDFARWQWRLAEEALVFVQEVAADLYMRQTYPTQWPDYLAERSVMFYRPVVPPADGGGVPGPLRPYRALNQLMRAELGLSIMTDPSGRADLEQRRDGIQALLADLDQVDRTRLSGMKDRMLGIGVGTDDTDRESYRELFDEVLRVVPIPEAELPTAD